MKAVTEAYLRKRFRAETPARFTLGSGMILTPAARQFLKDHRIELTCEDAPGTGGENNDGDRYTALETGQPLARKPEEMTQLHGRTLVRKDHPRIRLRGMLDSLQSEILLLQARFAKQSKELASDFGELLAWAREILRAEVLGTAPAELTLSGLRLADLRERSHNPREFYGIGHVLPQADMAPAVLELNRIRSTVREIELAAVTALTDDSHAGGAAIIETLNRMSSGIYILMLKQLTGSHGHE